MAGVATSPVAPMTPPEDAGEEGVRLLRSNVSIAEYEALPEEHPRVELLWGEMWIAPTPMTDHQSFLGTLSCYFWDWCKEHGRHQVIIAPADLQLGPDTNVQPDIMVLAPTHPQYRQGVPRITTPPLLVVEFVSRGSRVHDRKRKYLLYEGSGIANYWIFDAAAKTAEAFVLADGRYELRASGKAPELFAAPPFAGLSIDLGDVFTIQ